MPFGPTSAPSATFVGVAEDMEYDEQPARIAAVDINVENANVETVRIASCM
jgi:hypothetical protein